MATKTYVLDVLLGCVSTGSDDFDYKVEFYGSFSYRPEGQSSWIQLAQTSDRSPWIMHDGFGGFLSKSVIKVLPREFKIEIPTSSTFIEVQSSIKEYDRNNADEDLGTQIILVPVPIPGEWESQEGSQGDTSIGKAQITVRLVAAEDWYG